MDLGRTMKVIEVIPETLPKSVTEPEAKVEDSPVTVETPAELVEA